MRLVLLTRSIPVAAAAVAVATLCFWLFSRGTGEEFTKREPNEKSLTQGAATTVVDMRGDPIAGSGKPGDPTGAWPAFRGAGMDGKSTESIPLLTSVPSAGYPKLWELKLGEGYAGAAVRDGRVYILDYDEEAKADTLRCLSVDDGKEIWRRAYHVEIAWDHGYSRTVPTLSDRYVVAFGPKCHVTCVDAESGKYIWGIDLVREYDARVPDWYAGQCPLVHHGMVILGVGGSRPYDKKQFKEPPPNDQPLLIAVNLADGKVVWKTPNPNRWLMTHTCVVPMVVGGKQTYVYSTSGGVVGVSADKGGILWEFDKWQVPTATVASPVVLPDDRIYLSGGYNTGALILKITNDGGKWIATEERRLKGRDYGSPQHTPIFHDGFVYGIIPSGEFVCSDLDGKIVWRSKEKKFGLGGFIMAGGAFWIMSDKGMLTVVEASAAAFKVLGQMQVWDDGEEAWGPPAIAGGKLIIRDLKRMVCLDVRKK